MADRTVLVASSDRLMAEAVAAFLAGQPGWGSLGVAIDGVQALDAIRRLTPTAVLVIGDLPRLGPVALARQVSQRFPDVRTILIGRTDSADAVGLPPDANGAALLAALERAPAALVTAEQPVPDDALTRLRALTVRERHVMKLLAEGLNMRQIGERLSVSEHTVRTHMQNLYAKLGVHRRVEVVRFAARYGLIERRPRPDR
ncbi:MAG TPA: response regulator transcription factor [Actinomycetota bacterium]